MLKTRNKNLPVYNIALIILYHECTTLTTAGLALYIIIKSGPRMSVFSLTTRSFEKPDFWNFQTRLRSCFQLFAKILQLMRNALCVVISGTSIVSGVVVEFFIWDGRWLDTL